MKTKGQLAAPSSSPPPWQVVKFGGSSLANPQAIRQAIARIEERPEDQALAVVVSAMDGVTDRLLALPGVPAAVAESLIRDLRRRHQHAARQLLGRSSADRLVRQHLQRRLRRDCHRLLSLVTTHCADLHAIAAYGELWSARILAAALHCKGHSAGFVDARLFMRLDSAGQVDVPAGRRRLRRLLDKRGYRIPVITGFIARDSVGNTRTLGRNGSDYSAALVAGMLDAQDITIYSDVAGVLSADPDRIEAGAVVPELSYRQAERLARLGARVLHPRCIQPLREASIPLTVASTFRSARSNPGTRIHEHGDAPLAGIVCHAAESLGWYPNAQHDPCWPASLQDQSAAHDGEPVQFVLAGEPGKAGILVVRPPLSSMTGQTSIGSSPFAVLVIALTRCSQADAGALQRSAISLLTAAGMDARPCESRQVESCLAFAVPSAQLQRAAEVLHQRLFEAPLQRLSIALVGPGRVGSQLLRLIEQRAPILRLSEGLELRVCAIASSTRMQCAVEGLSLTHWQQQDNHANRDRDTGSLMEFLARQPNPVWIDATACPKAAQHTEALQRLGIAVVSANKHAATVQLPRFAARCRHAVAFLHGTTVAAGVPVIECAESLMRGGERVLAVRATLSGSLSWILAQVNQGQPFSRAVAQACQRGLTEPDPREDLSGMDVARKLVILGRHLGLALELDQIQVSPLLPAQDRDAPISELDPVLAQRVAQLQGRQQLCFVASIDSLGNASAGLTVLEADDPLLRGAAGDNVIEIRTTHYADNPLVLQGPGAGIEVTAAGLLSELLSLAEHHRQPARTPTCQAA